MLFVKLLHQAAGALGEDNDLIQQEFLEQIYKQGEFTHDSSNPFLNFVSSVLDITIIKPIIEACTGEGLKAFGKTALIDFAGNTAASGVGELGEAFDWPVPVTMMLSLAAGITISISGNKLLFKNTDGVEIGSKTLSDAEVKKIGDVRGTFKGGLNSYDEFSKTVNNIGTRTDLTDSEKISELQKLFANSNYKTDINVPRDIQYVKGFDAKGNVIYDWPPKLGFDESSIKPVSRTDGLPDTWDRYGYMGGSNFADVPSTGKYSYSERTIPYVENEAAYHIGTFNNVTYFDKIDAIKNGDIDLFNSPLQKEGITKWDIDEFEELCDNYDAFITKTNKELGESVDATYGIKGNAAEWGDMTGGAGQIVTPFGGDILKKIGILKEN